jgi:pimeloyl-ACP methyl ester carboxylesterase
VNIDKHHKSQSSFTLPFLKIGTGEKRAIAFHGFGQDSTYFSSFEAAFGASYTMYCFDLPYHGKHQFDMNDQPANKDELKLFFNKFLQSEKISGFMNIGFSIGAKLSLALMEFFPEKTENMVLIAPDGFSTNIWYKLATGSPPTRSVFKHMVYHPDTFFRISDAITRMNIVNPGVSRFARSQMSSVEKREKVYLTWMFFRKLQCKRSQILKILTAHKIPLHIFLGTEDKIIQKKQFEFLTHHKDINLELTLLPAGHNNLIEETAKYLLQSR